MDEAQEILAQKKSRLEQAAASAHRSAAAPTTLFVRSKKILNEYQLVHWFLYDNRVALGLDDQLVEPPGGPVSPATIDGASTIQAVYVAASRKPYLLLEVPTAEIADKLLAMNGVLFHEQPVQISVAQDGASVQKVRSAMAERSERKAAEAEKVTTPAEGAADGSAAVAHVAKKPAALSMKPRVLRK